LEEKIKKDLHSLLPEEDSKDYALLKSLLEKMALNQKRLVESDDALIRENFEFTKEVALNKGLEREKIENFCKKVAELVEIVIKKENLEFVEDQGKQVIRFNR
jgi:hypothetical protein